MRQRPAIRRATPRAEPSLDFHSVSAKRSHLSEFRLPAFSGGYTEFTDFQSMFKAIIDNDVELALRSCSI